MWNKRSDEAYPQRQPTPPQPEPIRSPAPPPATFTAQKPAPPEPAPARNSAAIGASMRIKGEIQTREDLLIDGEVEGTLDSHSRITVGQNGKVRANIKAREVVVFGSVRGNVEVTEKIAIREHGSVVGDVKTAGISIDDGAYFKGSIDIARPEPKVTTAPVKSEPRVEAAVG